VVDPQPDGDLMFDLGGLWMAARYDLPFLIVMYNNRAYYNDWAHQISVAKQRGTDVERAHVGMDLEGPAPDFAPIARGLGWHAEGPIEDPAELGRARPGARARHRRGQERHPRPGRRRRLAPWGEGVGVRRSPNGGRGE
jgi:acetolactate synthase-1/2/3 large subunit